MDASQARYVVVLTTVPLEVDVEAFAQALVAERLAACVNVLPPMHDLQKMGKSWFRLSYLFPMWRRKISGCGLRTMSTGAATATCSTSKER